MDSLKALDSLENYLLLAPGPVPLHPQVREILSQPMIHHRTPLFDQIFSRVLTNIKEIFQTKQPVFLLNASGSGGMEAALVNSCRKQEKVLCINSGKFGERWMQMAQTFGLTVLEHKVPWGTCVNPEDIREILEKNSDIGSVFCQACETSTGVSHPIETLGAIIHKFPGTLFVVDGITALGAYPLPMEAWHIDVLVAGSQKAFMLPTGMSFIGLSEKAWVRANEKTEENSLPCYYFDLRQELKANQKGESWFSANVAMIRALDLVLQMILSRGLSHHFLEIKKRGDFTRHFTTKNLGLELYSEKPSPSVTALKCLGSQKIRQTLEEQYQITVMGGQDQLKDKILRIGHMGFITEKDMFRFLLDLEKVLVAAGYKIVNPLDPKEMYEWWQNNG